MVMASIPGVEAAMLFVRCRDGLSHTPLEFVEMEDVEAAATALYLFLEGELIV